MTAIGTKPTEREPGPVWGGWWMWEPPAGAVMEEKPTAAMAAIPHEGRTVSGVTITNHAIRRWQQRIENVPEAQAVTEMLMALASADPKHFKPAKLKKQTFYIPTARAMFVGEKGKIVTVLERGQSPYDELSVVGQ